ncbi:MAG: SemiSWEET transporter [Acidobacteria bacterium]|nr:SemiSWEET transporter [Acidobacteriota bacterium]
MTPLLAEVIGYLAALLTTLAFVPQVVRTWRTRSAGDLSGTTLVAFTSGILLWLAYGVAQGSRPIVLANGATLVQCVLLVVMKIRFARQPPRP